MGDLPITGDNRADVIVVGAGVIGLACAWRAAERGLRVIVIESRSPGSGASGVAAGMLAPVGELSFGEGALLRLNLESAALFGGFVAELEAATGLDTGFDRCGALHVALDRDEAEQLRRRHRLQREMGLEAEWMSPRRCRELEPGLAPSIAGGVHAPREAAVDPRALCAALLAALDRESAEVRSGSAVSEALISAERLDGVRLESGEELRAAHVVLASGASAGASKWLPESARPQVRPVKGQIVTLRGPASDPVCERIVASERVYVVPRADGRLVLGATVEERGFDTTVTAGGVLELLREAYRLLPEIAELELLETGAGVRPGTPDNLPLIGPGEIDGLLLATGHYRNGVLLAPLTAERIAEAIVGSGVTA